MLKFNSIKNKFLNLRWQNAQLFGRERVEVEVTWNSRIVPCWDTRWNMIEVHLTLLSRSHFWNCCKNCKLSENCKSVCVKAFFTVARRKIDCRSGYVGRTTWATDIYYRSHLPLPLSPLRRFLFTASRRSSNSLCYKVEIIMINYKNNYVLV